MISESLPLYPPSSFREVGCEFRFWCHAYREIHTQNGFGVVIDTLKVSTTVGALWFRLCTHKARNYAFLSPIAAAAQTKSATARGGR